MKNKSLIIHTFISTLLIFSCAARKPQISPEEFFHAGMETSLFNGTTLGYWEKSDFFYGGKIEVQDSSIIIGMGGYLSGITWNGPLLRMNYEINLDAIRLEGNDFFCGLTFPYDSTYCSLIIGGWGGTTIGLSNVNDYDASENETNNWMPLKDNQWYHIRLQVTDDQIVAWVDDKNMVDLQTTGKKIDIRFDIEESIPLGIATYWTKAAIKNITIKNL